MCHTFILISFIFSSTFNPIQEHLQGRIAKTKINVIDTCDFFVNAHETRSVKINLKINC